MSVQQIDLKVLNAIGSGLVTVGHRKTCDEWYSGSSSLILNHGDIWENSKKMVKHLADMNALNYTLEYKNDPCESLSEFIGFGIIEVSIYQFLKWIQYSLYNSCDHVKHFSQEQKEVFKFFRNLEKDILKNIVSELPQYAKASWG